jgi:TonB family protein
MLNKNRSSQISMMKYGLIAPLFVLMIVVSSATLASKELAKIEGRKKLDDIVVMGYAEKVLRESKQDSIYNKIDQQAEFPGGMKEFVKYLRANIKYPAPAQRANISGKVYTQFIVNKDGSASDFKTLESIGYGCDEEAMRVIQSVPKWTPGKHKGEVVSSIFIVPISFRLSK